MPACIGMTARTSAPAVQCGDRPAPSVPSRMATLAPRLPARILRSRVQSCGHRGEVDGIRGQGQGHRGEPGGPQQIGARRPVGQPGPGQAEHGAHAHLDRPAVERVGRPRRQQRPVPAEGGGVAQHGADVGVVDHVLDHHQPLGRSAARRRVCRTSRCSEARAPRWTWKPVTSSAMASVTT